MNPWAASTQAPKRNAAANVWKQSQRENRVGDSGLSPNMTRGEIPFQYYKDWMDVQAKQEADRAKALDMYGQGRQSYMNNPWMNQSFSQYQNLMGSGGPFNSGYVARQQGALKNAAAVGWQDQQRQIAESLARRGLGGAPTDYQTQMAQQQAQAALSGQLAGQEQWAAQANEQALAQARAAMAQMGEEQARQAGLYDMAAANLVGSTEREVFPWEALLAPIEGRNQYVAGGRSGNRQNRNNLNILTGR